MKITLQNIHKYYGNVKANDGISLTVAPGTIHGILGENGAGKSTLMKILSGLIQKTSGKILIDDRPVGFNAPSCASAAGIGMLYQDPMDFPCLTVMDNFQIEKTRHFLLNRKADLKRFKALIRYLGFDLNPGDKTGDLTIGERRQLELLRLLGQGHTMLILDEPTTGISSIQKQTLFSALKKLAAQGRSIILVSHKLEDIDMLCDKVTVLCRGKVKGEMVKPFDKDLLIHLMFGDIPSSPPFSGCAPGHPVLSMNHISATHGRTGLTDCSVLVRQREIVGLAGLEGSGQEVFLRTAAGLTRPGSGELLVHDKRMNGGSYFRFARAGVTFLPSARLEEGLITGLSVREHVALKHPRGRFLMRKEHAETLSSQKIDAFHIKATPEDMVESLSGGNQQRLLLSLLPEQPDLLLLENPTRGLDIASVQWVWQYLAGLCASGTSIVFSSPDLDEILEKASRTLVFFNSRIIKDVNIGETTKDELARAISGVV